MNIGIYARGMSVKVGGVKEYIIEMTKAIINNTHKDDKLYIIHNLKNRYFNSKKANVEEIILNSNNKIVCDLFLAPKVINKLNLDIVWFTKNVIPFFIKSKKIVTIHDLTYFLPECQIHRLSERCFRTPFFIFYNAIDGGFELCVSAGS